MWGNTQGGLHLLRGEAKGGLGEGTVEEGTEGGTRRGQQSGCKVSKFLKRNKEISHVHRSAELTSPTGSMQFPSKCQWRSSQKYKN